MISLSLSLLFSDYVNEQSNLLEVWKIELMFISGLNESLYDWTHFNSEKSFLE